MIGSNKKWLGNYWGDRGSLIFLTRCECTEDVGKSCPERGLSGWKWLVNRSAAGRWQERLQFSTRSDGEHRTVMKTGNELSRRWALLLFWIVILESGAGSLVSPLPATMPLHLIEFSRSASPRVPISACLKAQLPLLAIVYRPILN